MEFKIPATEGPMIKVKFLGQSSLPQDQLYDLSFRDTKESLPSHLKGITVICNKKHFKIGREYVCAKGVVPKQVITVNSIRDLRVKHHELEFDRPTTQQLLMAQLWHHQSGDTEDLTPEQTNEIIKHPLRPAIERYGPRLKLLGLSSGIDWLLEMLNYSLTREDDDLYDALVHQEKLKERRHKTKDTIMMTSQVHPRYFETLRQHGLIKVLPGPTKSDDLVALCGDAYVGDSTKKHLDELYERGADELIPSMERCDHTIVLDEKQEAVLDAVRKHPVIFVSGPPGTGKTQLDYEMRLRFCPRYKVVSLMFLGTLVKERQKRVGCEKTVMTIHRAWHGDYLEVKHADIAIIDEFSNVDSRLFLMALEALENVKRLVILMDINQIPPIKCGSPALAMINAFPELCIRLTKNFRVDEGALMIKEVSDNINYHSPAIVMQCFKISPLCRRFDWPPYKTWEWEAHDTAGRLKRPTDKYIMDAITGEIIASSFHESVNLADVESWQTLTFKNDDVDRINETLEKYLLKSGFLPLPYDSKQPPQKGMTLLKLIKIPMGRDKPDLELYRGKKITLKATFKCKDEKLSSRYHEIRNGAILTIDSMYETEHGQEVVTTCGLRFLLHSSKHVKPRFIRTAFCVTVSRSVGSEWDHCMVFVPPKTNFAFWTCNFLYVACSRSKKSLVCFGDESVLFEMIVTPGRPRKTYLEEILPKK